MKSDHVVQWLLVSDDCPGTPSRICHNEVDTHYYSLDTIQKETRAMPLSLELNSAQTIAEEQDRKQQFPGVTWWCCDLELLEMRMRSNYILKPAALSQQ